MARVSLFHNEICLAIRAHDKAQGDEISTYQNFHNDTTRDLPNSASYPLSTIGHISISQTDKVSLFCRTDAYLFSHLKYK